MIYHRSLFRMISWVIREWLHYRRDYDRLKKWLSLKTIEMDKPTAEETPFLSGILTRAMRNNVGVVVIRIHRLSGHIYLESHPNYWSPDVIESINDWHIAMEEINANLDKQSEIDAESFLEDSDHPKEPDETHIGYQSTPSLSVSEWKTAVANNNLAVEYRNPIGYLFHHSNFTRIEIFFQIHGHWMFIETLDYPTFLKQIPMAKSLFARPRKFHIKGGSQEDKAPNRICTIEVLPHDTYPEIDGVCLQLHYS